MVASAKLTNWKQDLSRLRSGEITFDAFTRGHAGILRRHALKWARRCPERIDLDDAAQELRIAIHEAVQRWEPTRGVPLHAFVEVTMKFRLLGLTDRGLKGRVVEATYWSQSGECNSQLADESEPPANDKVEARKRLAFVVGSLDAKAADLVMSVVEGEPVEVARERIYVERSGEGATKKARAVLKLAREIAAKLDAA